LGGLEPRRYRVLLVEDDEEFVEALLLVIGDTVTLEVASTGATALAAKGPFDAALVDLGLPDGDGVAVVRELVRVTPSLPVVVLTVNGASARVLSAFQAGARGYLLKEQLGKRLVPALEEAMAGGMPLSPSVARHVLGMLRSLPAPDGPKKAEHAAPELAADLTERELAVLHAFADGMSYARAAEHLKISINTLRTHVRNIYSKLMVESRTEAVLFALELGLLGRTPE
jgi:DNA-binding NarL/FixJ family response regulator